MSSHWIKQAKEVFRLTNDDKYFETVVEYQEEVDENSSFLILWRYAIVRWLRRDPRLRYIRCEWMSPVQIQFEEKE